MNLAQQLPIGNDSPRASGHFMTLPFCVHFIFLQQSDHDNRNAQDFFFPSCGDQCRGVLSAASWTVSPATSSAGIKDTASTLHLSSPVIVYFGTFSFCYSLHDCAGVSWTTAIYKLDVLPTLYFLNSSLIFKGWASMSRFFPFSSVFLMHSILTLDRKRMQKISHSKGSWDKMPI